jgi:hypothetical protein
MTDADRPVIDSPEPRAVVLVVDIANVMGSRPDGWWRDRAGAATRLLDLLVPLDGAEVSLPDGSGMVRLAEIYAVLEGAAKRASGSAVVTVLRAPADGDGEIVDTAIRLVESGRTPVVVTADRGLRRRLPGAALGVGPEWLNQLLGR